MHVRVWHFQAHHGNTHPKAGKRLPDREGHLLAEEVKARKGIIVQVKDVIHFLLGNHQCMSYDKWINIQEGDIAFILGDDVTGNFTVNDSCENARHNELRFQNKRRHSVAAYAVMLRISNSISPAGVLILANSPFFLPSNPFPIGDNVEILPALRSASSSDTSV